MENQEIASMRHTQSKVDETHHAHHIVSPVTYGIVLVILLCLTAATYGVALINFGGIWNLVFALGIATLKASLVVLFFMHVLYSGRLIQIVIGASAMFLALLIFGTLMDVWTRQHVTMAGYPSYEVHP